MIRICLELRGDSPRSWKKGGIAWSKTGSLSSWKMPLRRRTERNLWKHGNRKGTPDETCISNSFQSFLVVGVAWWIALWAYSLQDEAPLQRQMFSNFSAFQPISSRFFFSGHQLKATITFLILVIASTGCVLAPLDDVSPKVLANVSADAVLIAKEELQLPETRSSHAISRRCEHASLNKNARVKSSERFNMHLGRHFCVVLRSTGRSEINEVFQNTATRAPKFG